MAIKEVVKVISHIVETDEKEWPTYRRDGPESWSRLIGEAWEPVFSCDFLEKEYQQYQ
jgi:hypothetical protein